MRIACFTGPAVSNSFYRHAGPMAALAAHGHDVRQLSYDEPDLAARVRDVDLLHVYRSCDARTQALIGAARAAGAAIVWDNDDDFGAVPKNSAVYRSVGGLRWERRLAEMKRIFGVAQLVTAPSEGLAERFRGEGATHVAVIENHLADRFAHSAARPHAGVVIGWVAGIEHQMDVERVRIREVLQQLLDERGDVSVVTIGLALGLRGERYRHAAFVPLLELAQEIAGFDIAIAPLADLDFNRARSNVKLKEYAAAGVPWLASPTGPYAGMGEQQGGRLVADDDWHEALTRLIDKPRERRKLAKRARRWAAGETIGKHVHVWEAHFEQAIARAGVPAAAR